MAVAWLKELQSLEAGRKNRPQAMASVPLSAMPSFFNGGYTGSGADGRINRARPAGVVEEGEFVVSAPRVKKMGGPANLEAALSQLEDVQTLPSYKEGGPVQGYNPVFGAYDLNDTNAVARDAEFDARNTADRARERANAVPTPPPAGTGITSEGVAKTAANLTPTPLTYKPAEDSAASKKYQENFLAGVNSLRDMSEGKSPVLNKIADVSRSNMAGQQAAETGGLRQDIAQNMGNAPGGAANAMMAMNNLSQQEATAQLETGIAKEQFNVAQQATRDLATAAMQGMSFEENKRQFGEQMAQRINEFNENSRQFGVSSAIAIENSKEQTRQFEKGFAENYRQFEKTYKMEEDKFKENVRQFGLDYALKLRGQNFTENSTKLANAVAAGDFGAAADLAKSMGMDIDFTQLQNTQNSTNVANGMADLTAMVTTNPNVTESDPAVQASLTTIWNSTHPAGADGTRPPMDAAWASNTVKNLKLRNDPVWGPYASTSDEGLQAMLPGVNIADFQWGSFPKGRDSAVAALVWAKQSNLMTMASDGTLDMDIANPQTKDFLVAAGMWPTDDNGKPLDSLPPPVDPNAARTVGGVEIPAGTANGTAFTPSGSTTRYFTDSMGNPQKVSVTSANIMKSPDDYSFGRDKPSYWNGSGWTDLTDGMSFEVPEGSPMKAQIGSGITIEPGVYKVQTKTSTVPVTKTRSVRVNKNGKFVTTETETYTENEQRTYTMYVNQETGKVYPADANAQQVGSQIPGGLTTWNPAQMAAAPAQPPAPTRTLPPIDGPVAMAGPAGAA